MSEINEALGKILVAMDEAENPILRARRRMKDAFARGGFHELHHRTRTRIKAMKNPDKLAGMRTALKQALADDEFPLTPSQEQKMFDLFSGLLPKV